jgi:hypothetical protein
VNPRTRRSPVALVRLAGSTLSTALLTALLTGLLTGLLPVVAGLWWVLG